ncbi:hypothetical protein SAMN02949497_3536 [Methylomagnum ishizawai]|uniref:Uncharacterized protein n=1 Tax=Methylomagnum ishizawai TaxID=1760988 RepID=A0A1Y6D0N0_9GAMM|nr:hypothetical protein [Methylomagnum ishizawai]SMF96151.1 hypothetical protein SAMN02949497_3536 [Methylomagnum ishizawai]
MSNGAFAKRADAFNSYLWTCAKQHEQDSMLFNGGLIGRNFLLDEGVPQKRVESYDALATASFKEWQAHHDAYLARKVYPLPPDEERPKVLDLNEEDLCPETFRIPARSPYLRSNPKLHLLRLVEMGFLRTILKLPISQLLDEARAALGQPQSSPSYQRFDRTLGLWQKSLALRPVYATYWEDMSDLFSADSTLDQSDWADQMRDRLGLAHLDPGERGGPIDVLIFRYAIEELPPIRQWHNCAPLMPPTVLDGAFSTAFCPAPASRETGHVVHLEGDDALLRREVMHPAMDYHAKHLWRIGQVRKPVRLEDLPSARAIHLAGIRSKCKCPDYAETTDGDLLA